MSTRIRLRRDTAANWTSNNPTLTTGEMGYETNTGKFKIGDNTTAWTSLPYSITAELSEGNLNDLKDVTITSAANGDFLRWNGTAWINDAVNLATDTVGSYVASLTAGTGITLSNNSGEEASPTVAVDTSVIQARVANVTDTEIGYLDGVTSAIQTQIDLKAPLASPTFTGTVTVPTPTNSTDAATKAYADTIAAGINWHNSVETATAAALPNTPTYSNGTSGVGATLTASANARLVMDGANATTGDRVLVKNQADATQNGIYVVTAQGSVSAAYVLTRASDHDNLNDEVIRGDAVYVANGATNANQGFIISSEGTGASDKHVLGTDDMNWSQFTGTANITAGTGITKTGNTLSIGQSVATNASVTFSAVTAALTGNASTATILETARNIAGQSFNGSANISIAPTDLTGVTSSAAELNILDGATLSTTELNYVDGVTSAIQTQIDLKAPLASPTFTGTVTIPSGASISGFAPLASPTFTGTVTIPSGASISGFAPLASPTFTGTVTIPTGTVATTQTAGNNSTAVATTAFVTDAVSTGVASATVDNLDDISDVVLTGATSGQFLKYNGTNWVNDAVPIISNIDDITGVTITAAADKDFLMYNGTAWVDQAITLGADTTGSYVASLVAGTGVTLTNNSGEGATPTIAIGQAVGTGSNVTFNDLTVSGNLTVSGTTTSINTETLTVDDNIIVLNNNATGAPSANAGLEVERGSSTNVAIQWNETSDKWELTNDGSTYGNLVTTADSLTVSAAMIADVVTNAQTASYTLVLGDKNKIVEMNVASGNNLTVPPNSSVAYPVGTQINILQVGAGQTTVVQGAGVTVNAAPGLKLRTTWSYATLIKRATDSWVLVGDISA